MEKLNGKQRTLYNRFGMTDLDPVTENMLRKAVSNDRLDKFVFGMGLLSFPSVVDQAKLSGFQVLTEQNFVLVKQNDEQMKLQRESNELQRQQADLQRQQNELLRENNALQSTILKEMRYNTDTIIENHRQSNK